MLLYGHYNLMDIDSKVLHLQKLVSLICSVHITAHLVQWPCASCYSLQLRTNANV